MNGAWTNGLDPTPASGSDERFPLELAVWLSPAFPIGSFAYSHGLEWAAGTGRIHDRASAAAWMLDLIEHGGVRNDAVLLTAAWRATNQEDWHALNETNELALALAGSRERRLETTAQGNAFMTTMLAAWATGRLGTAVLGLEAVAGSSPQVFPSPSRGGVRGGGAAIEDGCETHPTPDPSPSRGGEEACGSTRAFPSPLRGGVGGGGPGNGSGDIAYPVAVGLAAATHDISLTPTLSTFLTAVVGNLVSALVRLAVVGQTDGQRIIAALVPAVERLAGEAACSTLDDVGGAAFLSDIASMAHEIQDTRLFRT